MITKFVDKSLFRAILVIIKFKSQVVYAKQNKTKLLHNCLYRPVRGESTLAHLLVFLMRHGNLKNYTNLKELNRNSAHIQASWSLRSTLGSGKSLADLGFGGSWRVVSSGKALAWPHVFGGSVGNKQIGSKCAVAGDPKLLGDRTHTKRVFPNPSLLTL